MRTSARDEMTLQVAVMVAFKRLKICTVCDCCTSRWDVWREIRNTSVSCCPGGPSDEITRETNPAALSLASRERRDAPAESKQQRRRREISRPGPSRDAARRRINTWRIHQRRRHLHVVIARVSCSAVSQSNVPIIRSTNTSKFDRTLVQLRHSASAQSRPRFYYTRILITLSIHSP